MERTLFDLNPDPIIIFGKENLNILDANSAFLDIYGYADDQIRDLTLWDLWPVEFHDEMEDKQQLLKRERIKLDDPIIHQSRSGEIFHVKISAQDIDYEGTKARIAVIHDVTDQINVQHKLERAYRELDHLVKNSPLATIKWDLNFRVIEWSSKAKEITGYSEEEVMGETPDFFNFTEENRRLVEKEIADVFAGEKDQSKFEVQFRHKKDGDIRHLRIHASVLRDENGRMISTLTFL